MSQRTLQKSGVRFAANKIDPSITNSSSLPAPVRKTPSIATPNSRRAIRFGTVEIAKDESASSSNVSSGRLVVDGPPPAGASGENLSRSPPGGERVRSLSHVSVTGESDTTSFTRRTSFTEQTSTSTGSSTTGAREEAGVAGFTAVAVPPATRGIDVNDSEDQNIGLAVGGGRGGAGEGRHRTCGSLAGRHRPSSRASLRFQKSFPEAELRTTTHMYSDMEAVEELAVTVSPLGGDDHVEYPRPQWGSWYYDDGGISSLSFPRADVALVSLGDSSATQAGERQETGAPENGSIQAAQKAASTTNRGQGQRTDKDDVEGGVNTKKGTPKPPATLMSAVVSYVNELTKHPILDSGRKRVPFKSLQGRLRLLYLTSSAIVFVFFMELVLDYTSYHGSCVSPILYPRYRLPLKKRAPYPVFYGYGACEYNLGRSSLYEEQKRDEEDKTFDEILQIGDQFVQRALKADSLNAWKFSMMGALDTNKMRNYNEHFRLFTSIFMHGSWLHLLTNLTFNLILLWMIEPVWGFLRTTLAFFLSGVSASLLSAVVDPCSISVGASGALYGLAGSVIPLSIEFWDYLEYPVWLLILVVANLLITQVLNFFVFTSVDNWAHAGGFIAGMLYGFATATSLHAWRWEGVTERLSAQKPFLNAFSLESRERLKAASRRRVQSYKRRRALGKRYWPKVAWKWKDHEVEWIVRVLSSAILITSWILLILYLVVPSLYPKTTFGPLRISHRGSCQCCRIAVSPTAPRNAALSIKPSEGLFWCFLNSLPLGATCA